MGKYLVFELSGKFAHFSDPLTTPRYLKRTFNIIPKTTLFGLLGALIGLKGYSSLKEGLPEYYELLKDKEIFIIPKNYPFQKIVVKYNSLNSFANNDPNNADKVIINMEEEVILNPDYIIGIHVNENNELDRKIINAIRNNQSFYHIYLGKNEFFANVRFISLEQTTPIAENKVSVSSVIPLDYIKENIRGIDSIILDRMTYRFIMNNSTNFTSTSIKVGFLKDATEKIEIKDEFMSKFSKLSSGEIVCVF